MQYIKDLLINSKIYHGDCLEKMKLIDNKSVDLILCDLPYGTTKCKWDIIIPFEPLWEQYNRILKDNGSIVLNASQPFTSLLITSNIKMFKYSWVWEKNCPSNIACGNSQPLRYTEDICVFYKNKSTFNKQMIERSESGSKLIKQYQKNNISFKLSKSDVSSNTATEVDPNKYDSMLKNPSNLIYFGVERGKAHVHPTQKPLALFEYLIKTYTNEGDLVLDNCAGSGTTGVACLKLNRRFILIEKENEFVDIIKNRIKEEILFIKED